MRSGPGGGAERSCRDGGAVAPPRRVGEDGEHEQHAAGRCSFRGLTHGEVRDHRTTEIEDQVGSLPAFSRAFKRWQGQSPANFRRSLERQGLRQSR